MFLYISSLQIFYGFFDKYSKCVFPSGEDISVIKIRWRGNLEQILEQWKVNERKFGRNLNVRRYSKVLNEKRRKKKRDLTIFEEQ